MKNADETLLRISNMADEDETVYWTTGCENSFVLILEAYNRFLAITKDPRQATGLTLAWASLEGGHAARPD